MDRTCDACGADHSNAEDEWTFCPYCGAPLEHPLDSHEEER